MIALTRLGQDVTFYLNPDLIERMDAHVDTVIRLTNGIEYVVAEPPEVIVQRIIEYRRLAAMAGPIISRDPNADRSVGHPSQQPFAGSGPAGSTPPADEHATVLELPSNREVPR